MPTYQTDWQKADSLAAEGLPKSALAIVDQIYARAKAARNYPQMAKAALNRIAYRRFIDEAGYVSQFQALKKDIAETPQPIRSVLQSLLAELYWRYYEQNRYKLQDRTTINAAATDKTADSDPTTWDTRRLFTEITATYMASLQAAILLQKTPLGPYDAILEPGDTNSRVLRPTLYDLLAHRAIVYFQNTEPDIIRPSARFTLNNPAYLAGPIAFAKTPLATVDSLSGQFRALQLYQQLITQHLADASPLALADVDNLRLLFVQTKSVLPNKDALYQQTLEQERARFAGTSTAEADYEYALSHSLADLNNRNQTPGEKAPSSNRRRAAELARDLIKRFPKTLAGRNAELLLKKLNETSLDLKLEEVTEPGKPFRGLVMYRNVSTVFYRIYKIPLDDRYTINRGGDKDQQRATYRKLLAYPLAAEGQTKLPDDGDLETHSVEMPFSALPVGQYALLLTNNGKFPLDANQLSLNTFTVSQLSYLSHTNPSTGEQVLYVTDRQTGQPLTGVAVALMAELRDAMSIGKTDAKGRVVIKTDQLPPDNQYWIRLTQGQDRLETDRQYNYRYRNNQPDTPAETMARFFTDRAIYRPGQTIYLKGLIYRGKDNQFKVVSNQTVPVTLNDVNGETLSTLTLTTNEFGTFTGTFTAPTGRLTGIMTIQCAFGSTSIRVEEYKRPTFAVTIEPQKGAFKLEQTVTLSAIAKTLSGAVVDGASVRYHVSRAYNQPYWGYRKRPFRNSPAAEVASGEAQTDEKGRVQINFPATTDPTIPASKKPQFTFTITLDVTDRAGETRSASQTLRIGYSALAAQLTIPERVGQGDEKAYTVTVTNQAGEAVAPQTGTVVISRLQAPERTLRKRLWERPDRHLLSREAFVQRFPNDLYDNEDDPTSWPKTAVKTTGLRAISVADLPAGTYTADVTATDSTGEKAQQQVLFTVVAGQASSADAPSRDGEKSDWIAVQKSVAEPGEAAAFLLGTKATNTQLPMWVLMSVEENHQVVREEWFQITNKPLLVQLPVTEKQRGGFSVSFAMVQQGRFYTQNQTVTVPFTNKQLQIETQTFRDKLKPGQPETWTLRISGPAQDSVLAELVATLYDASLDQFVPHNWLTRFYTPYTSWNNSWQSGCFGLSYAQQLFNQYQPERSFLSHQYDKLMDLDGDNSLRITLTRTPTTIQGRVMDVRGQGIPGVTVALIGTRKGTTTDENGKFSIAATSAGSSTIRLQFSQIGYVSQEVALGLGKRLLKMPADEQLLNEVVVVGYGKSARISIRGAVAAMPMSFDMASPKQEELFVNVDQAPPITDEKKNQPAPPTIRKNRNETAFFFPQLQTDDQGRVVLQFTMPEALTRWRLMAFAHTKDLKTGSLTREIVTQKELMITANAPRFLREGDTLTLAARVNNLTDRPLYGSATMTLFDALTGEPAKGIGPLSPVAVMIAPGLSTAVSWTLAVPNGGAEAVTMRLTALAGSFSDGEETTIPVLPNRMLVTDTQPFWVNGPDSTSTFKLLPLTTLSPELPAQHERLTVEVTSNPAWYALQSLPYLMEYRYECAEQLFSRVYANSLAAHILNSRPAFRQVVDAWQRSAPKSPLQTNDELKAIALENTPWLADGQSETERTARLGQLFNANQLASEQRLAFDKLAQLQTESGGFRWFGGMSPDLTMTLHILGGFGHLQKLGVPWAELSRHGQVETMTTKAIAYADAQVKDWVTAQRKSKTPVTGAYFPVQYLYVRSFYASIPVDKAVLTYLTAQISAHWLTSSLQTQAMAALALNRFGNKTVPVAILKSARERATLSDELGMYWPENQSGLYWYQSPVETQACLIEAFDEIMHDQPSVDKARRWLLRQKQTQAWPSTKATTEAIYALLLRGSDWLNTSANSTVTVGRKSIESNLTKTDVATGYQKVVYVASEIKPEMGVVQISKSGSGPAWGAAYWQHFEPLDRVKPSMQATEAGLSVQKTLFVQTNSPEGPVLTPITPQTRLKPGDLITVRVVLKTDRLMEYVHLKDSRASGFEPVAVLSGYKYQHGLGYYEAPRDASTDFFISSLPVGTHVFEYTLRVNQSGDFSAGVATVQCFYAPEFAAHSAGQRVRVK